MLPLDYPLWLRVTHFFNFLFLSLLVRSGLEVLSAHPRLYWNDHCTPGSEWLKFTKKRRPTDRRWTASDEETSFPPLVALPGHYNLGIGRHWPKVSGTGCCAMCARSGPYLAPDGLACGRHRAALINELPKWARV